MVNLTDRFVRLVQCVDGKRTDFADDKVKGPLAARYATWRQELVDPVPATIR
jgi:hypothetical protein